MALKVSNKNRKKVHQEKIVNVQKEHKEFTKSFVRYYIIAFIVIALMVIIL